jgi:hypothetical protein
MDRTKPLAAQAPHAMRLTIEFLAWISQRPRTYAQTLEAWQSSCPRNSVFEDALGDELIQIERADTMDESKVTLTARGKLVMDHSRAGPNKS